MTSPAAPSVAAIVVSYHTGPVLWDCLEALAAQPEVERVVVVDNGNPPDVTAALRARAAAGAITLLEGHGNVGFGAGCNLGAGSAGAAAALMLVNPDVVLAPGAAAALLAATAGAGRPVLVGGRLLDASGREQRGARRLAVTPWSVLVSISGLSLLAPLGPAFRNIHRERDPLPAGPVPMPVVSGALMLLPAADYRALGGFDEGYFLHVEDIDLCRRVWAAGGTVLFAPGAVGRHARSTSDAPTLTVERHKAAGFRRYFDKFARNGGERAFGALVAGLVGAGLRLRAVLGRGKG